MGAGAAVITTAAPTAHVLPMIESHYCNRQYIHKNGGERGMQPAWRDDVAR